MRKIFKRNVPEGFYLVFGVGNCDACLDSGRFGFLFGDKIIGKIKSNTTRSPCKLSKGTCEAVPK